MQSDYIDVIRRVYKLGDKGKDAMQNEGKENIVTFESVQHEIELIQSRLTALREGRRSIAMVLTKLDEARLWLGEAIMTEEH